MGATVNPLVFNKALLANNRNAKHQWGELVSLRKEHEMQERFTLNSKGVFVPNKESALIPTEAYRELDRETVRVIENDEGRQYMSDLMGIAKSVHIGTTLSQYRRASDKSGQVTRSLSGQNPTLMSQTDYDFEGDPVPIFSTGYARTWREQETFTSVNFDAMIDDQHNSTRDLMEDMSIYMLYGETNVEVRGFQGQGIINHRNTAKINLGSAGSNVNLSDRGTLSTADEIVQFFTRDFAREMDANYIGGLDVLWISPSIRRRWQEPYSLSGQFKEGTIEDYIKTFGRIKDVRTTFELGRAANGSGAYDVDDQSRANEFFGYVRDQRYLCPLVGSAISTVAIPRVLPFDDHHTMIWSAMGMRVIADRNGRSGVFYANEQ